ncbi:MAG: hypothetical protein GY729_13485 [Desulfobacteraceae bacterium]|nr:hypothetical protein [Desulfobacteraceae bacterium]
MRLQTFEFSSIKSLHHCLKRGIGFTICPKVSVEKQLLGKKLIKLSWDIPHYETSVIMLWHKEKWCSPLLNHFMDISAQIISV